MQPLVLLQNLIKPFEETTRKVFLPNLTGQNAFSDTERDLLALSAHPGGLGIFDPCIVVQSLQLRAWMR